MKMMLRKQVLFLLLISVLAPIVLFSDTLGVYQTPPTPGNEFVEDVSTFTLAGETRPLNVLPQESSAKLKEPMGMVYPKSSIKTRQLTEESAEDKTTNLSVPNENPIREVVDMKNEPEVDTVPKEMNKPILGDVKEEIRSQHSEGSSKIASEKKELKHQKRSSRASAKSISRGQLKAMTEKQIERGVPPDARVRKLKDQLVQAKVYLSLTDRIYGDFIRELRVRVKDVQRVLGDATKDTELSKNANDKMKAMDQTLLKAKQMHDDCAAVVKKLRAMLHSTEEQLRTHKTQTLFLTHLTAKTVPKGQHCLPLRLSSEYFMLNSSEQSFPNKEKLEDPKLYHYALFSDNILAAAVVVNSTITHAKDPSKHVFHVVTDRLNYASMKMWFLANPPGKATIQVQNIEEFTWLNSSYSPVLKQLGTSSMIDYYFRSRHAENDSNLKYRNPKYLSIMNHLRFYLPEIFPKLDKVLFLDDDVVVQKDLSGLWSLDLKGKVVGVVETCGESFHRFDRYLNFSNPLISKNFDPHACGWAFGMNIFDLDQWRKQNITEVYHRWQNLNEDRSLWKLGTLPPGLITFWKQTHALDKSWHVLGLGYNPNVPQKDIERAAVIHYNGNLKPWLEIGIPKFRNYWSKFLDYDQLYLRECNITP